MYRSASSPGLATPKHHACLDARETTKNRYSSSLFIAFCLAFNRSAKLPARLGGPPPPLGVAAPLPLGVPPFEYPLSLGASGAGGALFLPTGLFAGGAGGVGLAFTAGAPFVFAAAGVGGGGGRVVVAGGGGGGTERTSSR